MLVKQLESLGDSQSAGIVLGGRVPIALSSRADSTLQRVTSCALAVLVSRIPRPAIQGRAQLAVRPASISRA